MTLTIGEAIDRGLSLLTESESPKIDVELLLCAAMDTHRTTLFAWPERALSEQAETKFIDSLQRRKQGHPIAHILQTREFWSLPLEVSSDTLIPRPDTELLVELTLQKAHSLDAPSIADLGTGTGAIALAIASERKDAAITATDFSEPALTIAKRNCTKLGFSNVQFFQGSWCQALPNASHYDLIVSNPPYIRNDDPHLSQGDVRFEPRSALVSKADGLGDIETIIRCAKKHLKDNGWLLLEHGYDQALEVAERMKGSGYHRVESYLDLGQNPRATVGQKAAP